MKRLIILLFILGLAGAGFLAYSLTTPYAGFTNEAFIDIPRGTSTREVGRILAEAGVVRSAWTVPAAQVLRRGSHIQAGEYRFEGAASVWQVLSRLNRGDIYTLELVIPEGSNMFDVAAAVERLGVIPAKAFLKVAGEPKLIKDLDPKAPSLEGYLFPATYRLTRKTTAEQLSRDMTQRFRKAWTSLESKADVHDVVTLASLVEKEAAVPQDRELISSVFHNRLSKNMSLDCDPTTVYAALLENRYRGTIYRSDLASKNPYNTYQHPGLPPGPIASPGLASLKAALHPAQSDYLFFVVKPGAGGAHAFSTSLAEHSAAVARYRKGSAGQ